MDKQALATAVAHLEQQGVRQRPEVYAYLEGQASEPLPSKYHNQSTEVDGIRFDSKAEANRYCKLKLLERAGVITDLATHPRYLLLEGVKGKRRAMHYEGDFAYTERGQAVVEDVKGVQTALFKAKAKLFQDKYPQLELRIVEC